MKDDTQSRIVYELKQEISRLKRSIYDFKRRIARLETELNLGPIPPEPEWFPPTLLNREAEPVVPVKCEPVVEPAKPEPQVEKTEPKRSRTRTIINKYLK